MNKGKLLSNFGFINKTMVFNVVTKQNIVMSHLSIKRKCVVCNEEFTSKSSKGIYCSKICFKRNWRKLQKENIIVVPKVKPIITKEVLITKHYLSVKEAVIFFEISEVQNNQYKF